MLKGLDSGTHVMASWPENTIIVMPAPWSGRGRTTRCGSGLQNTHREFRSSFVSRTTSHHSDASRFPRQGRATPRPKPGRTSAAVEGLIRPEEVRTGRIGQSLGRMVS